MVYCACQSLLCPKPAPSLRSIMTGLREEKMQTVSWSRRAIFSSTLNQIVSSLSCLKPIHICTALWGPLLCWNVQHLKDRTHETIAWFKWTMPQELTYISWSSICRVNSVVTCTYISNIGNTPTTKKGIIPHKKIKERKAHNNSLRKTSNNNRRKTKASTAHSSITTTLMD
jgi:hypothetical protein